MVSRVGGGTSKGISCLGGGGREKVPMLLQDYFAQQKRNTMTKGFFGSSKTPARNGQYRLDEKKEARYRHLVSPLENKNKTPEIRGKSPRKDPTRPWIPRRVYPSWNSAPLSCVPRASNASVFVCRSCFSSGFAFRPRFLMILRRKSETGALLSLFRTTGGGFSRGRNEDSSWTISPC